MPKDFKIIYYVYVNNRTVNIAIISLVSLILLCAMLIPVLYKVKIDKEAKRLYRQGMEYYNEKDYSNAYYNFKQIKKFSNLHSLALLKCFQCANNLQDKKTAQIAIKELAKKVKDENIRPYILYNDAILSEELQTDSDKTQLKKFKYIYENYSSQKNDFSYAAAFRYAKLVEQEDKYQAKDKYIEYLSFAPSGKYAKEALSSIEELEVSLNEAENKTLADAYFENGNYSAALEKYSYTKFQDSWAKISKCYKNLRNFNLEKETIEKGLQLSYSTVEEKELSTVLERYITLSGGNKIQVLQDIFSTNKNKKILPTVEYKLAESMTSLRSIKFYEDIVENYPDSFWASNSLWEIVWYNYQQNRFQAVSKIVEQNLERYSKTQDAPRISYWYAKALLNQHKFQEARDILRKTINDYPLSFYAFLSARQLKISKSKKIIIKKPIADFNFDSINKHIFKNPTLFLLAKNNDWQTIEELKIDDPYIKSWVLYKKGQYPAAINIIRKEYLENYEETRFFSDWQLKLLCPVLYQDLINKTAKEYKRSPYLFLSLVREESHFNKNANSSVGAVGLSQVMPATADFITKRSVTRTELLNEETNIDIGLKYYSYLVDYFEGNEFLAIMAYNAGPGNINKWIKAQISKTNEIDVFIENVPYLETKNYIKKILSSYWIYINTYSNKYIL